MYLHPASIIVCLDEIALPCGRSNICIRFVFMESGMSERFIKMREFLKAVYWHRGCLMFLLWLGHHARCQRGEVIVVETSTVVDMNGSCHTCFMQMMLLR